MAILILLFILEQDRRLVYSASGCDLIPQYRFDEDDRDATRTFFIKRHDFVQNSMVTGAFKDTLIFERKSIFFDAPKSFIQVCDDLL